MLGTDDVGAASITYREIKRRIVDLYYEVGEKLSETRLAEDLGVGRSPVRTALLRLKSEGWIDISPQSGTYIKALTPVEIREVADLRALLEMRAASDAATRISNDILRELRAEFIERQRDVSKGDPNAFITMDNRLHAAIYDVTDNSLIRNILFELRDKVQWIRRVCAVSTERVQDGYRELGRVLDALEQRNERKAALAMRDHVKSAADFCEELEAQKLRRRNRHVVDQLRSSVAPFENEASPLVLRKAPDS